MRRLSVAAVAALAATLLAPTSAVSADDSVAATTCPDGFTRTATRPIIDDRGRQLGRVLLFVGTRNGEAGFCGLIRTQPLARGTGRPVSASLAVTGRGGKSNAGIGFAQSDTLQRSYATVLTDADWGSGTRAVFTGNLSTASGSHSAKVRTAWRAK